MIAFPAAGENAEHSPANVWRVDDSCCTGAWTGEAVQGLPQVDEQTGKLASLRAGTLLVQSARCRLRRLGRPLRLSLMRDARLRRSSAALRRSAVSLGTGIAVGRMIAAPIFGRGPVIAARCGPRRLTVPAGGPGRGRGRTHRYCSTVTRLPRVSGTASTSGVTPSRLLRSATPISCHPGSGIMCAGSAALQRAMEGEVAGVFVDPPPHPVVVKPIGAGEIDGAAMGVSAGCRAPAVK